MGFWTNLGKTITRAGIKIIAAEFLRRQLNKIIKKQIVISAVKTSLFLVALLIPFISFLPENISLYISSLIITGLLLHTVIRIIQNTIAIVKTYRLNKDFIHVSFKKYSDTRKLNFSALLADYIMLCHPWAVDIKVWLDKRLKGWVPTADELAAYLWKYVKQSILVFGIAFTLFIVSFNLIARPMLQLQALEIGGLRIYFVPFFMAIDFLFKTQLMQILY